MRILFWLAILPSIILARRVLAYDRIEKEPFGLLAKLFVLGMLSCIPAGIIEGIGSAPISYIAQSKGMLSALMFLLLVPGAEECMKYLVLGTTRKNPNFNYAFDGIVYGTMVGLGFATLENILYVFEFQTISTAIMRGLLSVPLHCTCGIFMGYYYGVYRGLEARGKWDEARKARSMALVVPWMIHGIYDFSLDVDSLPILILGFAFTFAVFWMASRQVRIASANDAPIMVSLDQLRTPLPHEGFGLSSYRRGNPPRPFNG